ncbi:MAG: hypothetical protein RL651_11 [Pseudomonadota bacterium]
MSRCLWAACVIAVVFAGAVQAQEIEARLYSNAPINYNFLGVGFTQVTTNKFQLNTEVLAYNRTFDFFGQSGKVNLIVPYAQLHGHTTTGSQVISGSSVGLTDPIIRLATNLYGAPALSVEEFKHYQQDLIIGANLSAALPWGEYNSNQLFNVGANRSFIQPGLGVSQGKGPWRFELSGDATFFSNNNNFYGGNVLSQNPIYSGTGHVIYYFPSTAWLSTDITYYSGGQSFVNGMQKNNAQENWLFGATFSMPINTNNAIKFHAAEGSFFNQGQYYTMYGVVWQFRWAD